MQVERARAAIVSAGRDDTSILIVLTASRLASRLPISVVIEALDNEVLARQAGADVVINPTNFAGLLLAGSTHGRHIADYLSDLASSEGRVSLRERPAASEELGKPLSAIATGLGVRLYRGETSFGAGEPEAERLAPGDLIVEIVSGRA